MRALVLKGVRQNNLKNIDLELPLGRTVVITGPSGSGKSSLAFETIYAEGQRRYMASLSTYARQFLQKFRAPDVDEVRNIPPTIALEQINPVRNSRATVGTTTEIYDYFRLLFEKLGREHCATCGTMMERLNYTEIYDRLIQELGGKTALLAFWKTLPPSHARRVEILEELLRSGYTRVISDGNMRLVQELLSQTKLGNRLGVIVDRILLPSEADKESLRTRVTEALRQAMELGLGEALAFGYENQRATGPLVLTTQSRCPACGERALPRQAISFSFNSPLGACDRCKGFGNTLEIDPELVVPNPNLPIARGAIDPFTKPSLRKWQKKLLEYCKQARIDADLPWRELSSPQRKLLFEGDKKFIGVKGVFQLLEREKYKMRIRVFISRYTSPFTCPKCKGARLNSDSLRVKVGGKSVADLCALTIEQAQTFFNGLRLSSQEKAVAKDCLAQITRRLNTLMTVGLSYLTLSRLTRSLSGGEYQRLLLATQLSQGLTDTLYVLDEPSIGLHPKDTEQLFKVLGRLKDQGNSILIVEHDPDLILWAEHVVEIGPGSGQRGGQLIFAGSRERFLISNGPTAEALRDWQKTSLAPLTRFDPDKHDRWLEIRGAAGNNLKNIDVRLPLGALVAVTGVSGSGKSTLVVDTLFQALSKMFHGKSDRIERFSSISGFEHLGGVELVDQSPIGRSSRSNPITFTKGYDEIRSLFASTRDAVAKGFTPGHFSFNVAGGRCDTCEGEGRVQVDLVFMEDIWIPCETCEQKRFKPQVLSVRYRGRNIDEILRMTIDEAHDFFEGSPSLRAKLSVLREVGLGYLQLGQPGFTLSGGEAQRLKIARELSQATSRARATLFILDEPTTGLHFNEVRRLTSVFRSLVRAGHSVVVIEHNLQLIAASDYVVDLGPDGGDRGGQLVDAGPPLALAQRELAHTGRHLKTLLELASKA